MKPTSTACWSKAKGSRSTLVTASANHVRFAVTLASMGVTYRTPGASLVTQTLCKQPVSSITNH